MGSSPWKGQLCSPVCSHHSAHLQRKGRCSGYGELLGALPTSSTSEGSGSLSCWGGGSEARTHRAQPPSVWELWESWGLDSRLDPLHVTARKAARCSFLLMSCDGDHRWCDGRGDGDDGGHDGGGEGDDSGDGKGAMVVIDFNDHDGGNDGELGDVGDNGETATVTMVMSPR